MQPAPGMLHLRLPALLCVGLAAAAPGWAHDAFESSTFAWRHAGGLEIEITVARTTAVAVTVPGPELILFQPEDFPLVRPRLLGGAGNFFVVNDGALTPGKTAARMTPDGDVTFTLHYPAPPPGPLRITAVHLVRLGPGYTSSFTYESAADGKPRVKLLTAADPDFIVAAATPGGAMPATTTGFAGFLRLGIEHILTGYDHLLFLCGLLVACRRLGSMVGIITCFTVAHSLTLGLAALGLFSLPGRLVEPLIAASIVFVGLENLIRREEPKGRWALTFGFGLVHGFGFAGVLQEIGLGHAASDIVPPLLGFNLGVELGQLAVMAVLLPLLLGWRQHPSYERYAQPAASVIVAGAGAVWLLQRTLLA